MVPVRALSVALLLWAAPASAAPIVVTFENPTVPVPLPAPNPFAGGTRPFENGANLTRAGSFTTQGVTFNNDYLPAFDAWSGWSYSAVADVTTPGFLNQYAAYNLPGGGSGDGGSANYGVAFAFAPGDATIDLPTGFRPDSVRLTNTTYAALSILNGDQFARAFGPGDFFRLTISGTNAGGGSTGSVEFFLADFRNGLSAVVSEWTTVDLSGLGADTIRLSLGFTSTDVGPFGINTPTYVAVDNLVLSPVGGAVEAVPEPSSLGLLAAAAVGGWCRSRRRVRFD